MTKQTAKIINFPEETYTDKVKGIYMALDYLSNEAKGLGLKFTAHIVGAAADMAVIEMVETEDGQEALKDVEEQAQRH